MQAPGGPEEDSSTGFQYGGWSVPLFDEGMLATVEAGMQQPFDLLLGRKTYDIFAAHWPFKENDPIADAFNKATKYVATRTLTAGTWAGTELLKDDVVAQLKAIKQSPGKDLQVWGSSELLQTLIQHHLVDEFNLMIFPVVIGGGKKLFEEGVPPTTLELVSHRVSGTGVLVATYRAKGELELGSFALKEPTALELERRANNNV